jgi:hypothetical protein
MYCHTSKKTTQRTNDQGKLSKQVGLGYVMKYHLGRSVLPHLLPMLLPVKLVTRLLSPPPEQQGRLPELSMQPVTPHMLPTTLSKQLKLQTSLGNVSGNTSTFRSIFIQL